MRHGKQLAAIYSVDYEAALLGTGRTHVLTLAVNVPVLGSVRQAGTSLHHQGDSTCTPSDLVPGRAVQTPSKPRSRDY